MGRFVGNIELQVIPGDPKNWIVAHDFSYVTTDGRTILVTAGSKTDLASTPRATWWLYPPFGLYTGAAIVHDQLYTTQVFERSVCDAILLEAMEAEGVSWITRHIIYRQVRMWGWVAWDRQAKLNKEMKPAA